MEAAIGRKNNIIFLFFPASQTGIFFLPLVKVDTAAAAAAS